MATAKKTTAKAETKTAAKKTATKKTETKKAETKAAAPKAAAKKAETKAAAPKAAAKKTETKAAAKPAAKKTTKKVDPKFDLFIQYAGATVSVKDIEKNVKKVVKGKKAYTVYVKPEESKAYIVADGETTGMDVFFVAE